MAMIIHWEDLEIWTRLGVPAQERAQPQKLLVCLDFSIDEPNQDEINATVDYATVAFELQRFAETHACKLLESLCQNLTDFLQKKFNITLLELTVKKFILPNCRWVSVTLKRASMD